MLSLDCMNWASSTYASRFRIHIGVAPASSKALKNQGRTWLEMCKMNLPWGNRADKEVTAAKLPTQLCSALCNPIFVWWRCLGIQLSPCVCQHWHSFTEGCRPHCLSGGKITWTWCDGETTYDSGWEGGSPSSQNLTLKVILWLSLRNTEQLKVISSIGKDLLDFFRTLLSWRDIYYLGFLCLK